VLSGLPFTIGISLISILFAAILALLGVVAKLSNNSIAQGIAGLYVSLVRGTPLLVQIFIIYNGLPQIGTALIQKGMPQLGNLFILTAIQSGILALSLNYGAYMTEIFRAGIQSISGGQREAAESISMSRVILPQTVRVIIPDFANQFIAMQKD
jgi:polar amino acid transport system permease protein